MTDAEDENIKIPSVETSGLENMSDQLLRHTATFLVERDIAAVRSVVPDRLGPPEKYSLFLREGPSIKPIFSCQYATAVSTSSKAIEDLRKTGEVEWCIESMDTYNFALETFKKDHNFSEIGLIIVQMELFAASSAQTLALIYHILQENTAHFTKVSHLVFVIENDTCLNFYMSGRGKKGRALHEIVDFLIGHKAETLLGMLKNFASVNARKVLSLDEYEIVLPLNAPMNYDLFTHKSSSSSRLPELKWFISPSYFLETQMLYSACQDKCHYFFCDQSVLIERDNSQLPTGSNSTTFSFDFSNNIVVREIHITRDDNISVIIPKNRRLKMKDKYVNPFRKLVIKNPDYVSFDLSFLDNDIFTCLTVLELDVKDIKGHLSASSFTSLKIVFLSNMNDESELNMNKKNKQLTLLTLKNCSGTITMMAPLTLRIIGSIIKKKVKWLGGVIQELNIDCQSSEFLAKFPNVVSILKRDLKDTWPEKSISKLKLCKIGEKDSVHFKNSCPSNLTSLDCQDILLVELHGTMMAKLECLRITRGNCRMDGTFPSLKSFTLQGFRLIDTLWLDAPQLKMLELRNVEQSLCLNLKVSSMASLETFLLFPPTINHTRYLDFCFPREANLPMLRSVTLGRTYASKDIRDFARSISQTKFPSHFKTLISPTFLESEPSRVPSERLTRFGGYFTEVGLQIVDITMVEPDYRIEPPNEPPVDSQALVYKVPHMPNVKMLTFLSGIYRAVIHSRMPHLSHLTISENVEFQLTARCPQLKVVEYVGVRDFRDVFPRIQSQYYTVIDANPNWIFFKDLQEAYHPRPGVKKSNWCSGCFE